MKVRNGFVSNSSSSSFVIISADGVELFSDGDSWTAEQNGLQKSYIDIDIFIQKLQRAKELGASQISIGRAGGYDG